MMLRLMRTYTDDDGRFEFYAVPGKYTVKAVPDSGLRAEQEFAVVGTEPHEANMVISKNIPVKGRVVAGEPPMPMGRVTTSGSTRRTHSAVQATIGPLMRLANLIRTIEIATQ